MKEVLLKIGKDALIRADLKKIKNELIDQWAEPSLKKAVDEASNPIVKIVIGAVYESLESVIKKKLDEEIDKLLK